MGRPGLRVGTAGNISAREVGPKKFRARCRFRDYDGTVRYVVRYGTSKGNAVDNLKEALRDRTTPGGEDITGETRVDDLAAAWIKQIEDSDLARSTKGRYRTIVDTFIHDGLGQLRINELGVPACDRFLAAVRTNHGAATAKSCRSVLSGLVRHAMRHGAMDSNPVREVVAIPVGVKKVVRALERAEEADLLEKLRADEDALAFDLPDLCAFMLGTGLRVGEACALRMPQVDLDAGTVEVSATVTKFGIEERPKSKAGWRVIAVPPKVVELLRRRIEEPKLNTDLVLFPSPRGKVRDTSNLTGDLRRVFDRAGYEWVTSHIFRKTVATRLDEAGQSPRQIADHLGHAQPSMTLDVYMGRRVATADAATILE